MHDREYEVLNAAEESHWWYIGLRDALVQTLRARREALPARPRVLDAGCGCGANLRLLGELLSPSYLGGFDVHPSALEFARKKAPQADIYQSDICDPDIHVDQLDLIVSSDVLYIPGIAAAKDGMKRLVGRLASGGLLVLNLPAYQWLYSDHDVAIGTKERYTTRTARRFLSALGLQVELLTYRICFLFPAVVLVRLPSILGPKAPPEKARSDVWQLPPSPVNAVLAGIVKLENRALVRGLRFPFGSSVFAVARKPP